MFWEIWSLEWFYKRYQQAGTRDFCSRKGGERGGTHVSYQGELLGGGGGKLLGGGVDTMEDYNTSSVVRDVNLPYMVWYISNIRK